MNRLAVKTKILSLQIIPRVNGGLKEKLRLWEREQSIGIITTDCDDVSYAAIDEATKKADVRVAYAKSMYGGAGCAGTRLAGEFIGILTGPDPENVKSGLEAAKYYIENEACFYRIKEEDSIVYFAHCICRSGSYLSKEAGIPEGRPLAYLIAPPGEAILGLDAALKAADVELCLFYGPPTETNFAGGLLTGEQSACRAACTAFAEAVCRVGKDPVKL